MEHVTVAEIVLDALQDGTIGVNELLMDIPLNDGHPVPPEVEAFVSVFSDDQVAREWPPGGMPTNWPALIVGPDAPGRGAGDKSQNRLDFTGLGIGVTYATGKKEASVAMTDGAYTIRAVGRTLTKLLEDGNANLRQKNDMQVYAAVEREVGSFDAQTGKGRVTAALTIRFNVRDLSPGG